MKTYIKSFLLRGMLFGGFGPIILGIVYAVLQNTLTDFSLSGTEVLLAIISTYLLAFLQAGASVFNQIESWPITRSLLFHFLTVYIAYSLCYLVNSWIPFEPAVLLIFTLIFIISYFVIWITVYFSVKSIAKKFNKQLIK